MAIVQDVFSIPNDIATGLATGLYRRIGSVVRYATGPNKGQIVKHLKPVNLKTTNQERVAGVKVFHLVKQNKKGTIITVISAAAVGTGLFVYNKVKNHELKVVKKFRTSLRIYIDEIRKGDMHIENIYNLMNDLETLKSHKDYDKISIQLTTEDLDVLVSRIYEYTVKLAKDNKVELTEEELNTSEKNNTDTIINLQTYLKAQKRIFEEVA